MEPFLIGAGLLGLLVFLLICYLRGRRIRIRTEHAIHERARDAERDAEARERKHGETLGTRREARERARIAYPDLLDAAEANACGERNLKQASKAVDENVIREARQLIKEEIALLEKDGAARNVEWYALKEEADVLEAAHNDAPSYREPALYLDGPARVIDCGEAGLIELFTAAQVRLAREQSGFADYVTFLKRRAEAPKVAERIVERAKLRAVLLQREKREAEAAITTKLRDLPVLPNKDQ